MVISIHLLRPGCFQKNQLFKDRFLLDVDTMLNMTSAIFIPIFLYQNFQ